ncbi:Uncharacterised protein [Vibrio cholerae]|nr:Uncharacterised protein [Vibrio cholerae]CSB81626.1 Uncharacterised protein [Vibrio cholerae]
MFACTLNAILSKGNASHVSRRSTLMKITLFSSPWMVLVVELFKPLSGDMSINLCGR